MHNPEAEGGAYFVCDFCSKSWSDERPMVEGHRGSLICSQCLSIAYTEVVHLRTGSAINPDEMCIMCRETERPGFLWRSPVKDDGLICTRCVKQSAGVLVKDPEYGWSKPSDPSAE